MAYFKNERERLEYTLKLTSSECEMLNETLMQMYDRNVSQETINQVRSEVIAKMNEVSLIREQLNDLILKEKDEEKVEYSTYKKASEDKSSFFDAVAKKTNAAKFSIAMDSKEKEDEKKKYECSHIIRDKIDKLSLEDNKISSNMFIVDLSQFGIDELEVKSVDYDLKNSRLYIIIYDHVTSEPVVQRLSRVVGRSDLSKKDIVIKHLNNHGEEIYNERYSGVYLVDLYRSPLDYGNDTFSTIALNVQYNKVEYATPENKEG